MKKSGFKVYNDKFWHNDKGKTGVRYQCRSCGKVTLGMFFGKDENRMHLSDCEYRKEDGEPEAKTVVPVERPPVVAQWEDVYSAIGTKARIRLGKFSLVVHHLAYDDSNKAWFATCHHGPINAVQLEAKTIDDAKEEALAMFEAMLSHAANDMGLEVVKR